MINRLLNHIHRFLAQDLIEFKADITNLFVRAINSIKKLPVIMEDKRLNINQPLLSVRRHSPKAASQNNESRKFGSYLPTMPPIEPLKTEFKLSPLKNTGNIPFVWEHSPGRPKDHETHIQIEHPLGIPKLPPGRISKPKKKDHHPDNTITTEDHHSSFQTVFFQTESRFDRSKSTKKDWTSDYNHSHTISSDEQDDSNETFMDALDTLSRTDQSSFYNCSTSGVNVNGNGNVAYDQSDMNRSDPKLRDFMMGRFLPAAKAMASDPPHQHSSKKQIFNNNPRDVKKLANMENKKLQLRYGPTFLQDNEKQEHEQEDDDSDYEFYEEHGSSSFKFCGLIPRFCSKGGSLNLVGPVPGISMRTKTRTRTHLSNNSLGSFIEIENKSFTTRFNSVKKHDSIQASTSNQRNCNYNNNNPNKLEGSKLYNRLQGCGSFNSSFQSPVSENGKKRLSFKELLNDRNRNEDSIVEKTLYVDTENSIPSNNLTQENGRNGDTRGGMESEVGDQSSKDSDEDSGYDLPAPPPLPKSPSDSWLGRALPSVSNKRWNPRFRPSDAGSESDKTTPLRLPKGPLLPIPEN